MTGRSLAESWGARRQLCASRYLCKRYGGMFTLCLERINFRLERLGALSWWSVAVKCSRGGCNRAVKMCLQPVSPGQPLPSVSLRARDWMYFLLVLLGEVYLSWINSIHICEQELSCQEGDDPGSCSGNTMVAVALSPQK